jgi:hypothetical protein
MRAPHAYGDDRAADDQVLEIESCTPLMMGMIGPLDRISQLSN